MKKIKIQYLNDDIKRLEYIDGKSDWIETYAGPNDWWYMPAYALRDTEIHKNDRICQFRIMEHQPTLLFEECERLEAPDRGGIGSTGKN